MSKYYCVLYDPDNLVSGEHEWVGIENCFCHELAAQLYHEEHIWIADEGKLDEKARMVGIPAFMEILLKGVVIDVLVRKEDEEAVYLVHCYVERDDFWNRVFKSDLKELVKNDE